MADTQQEQEGDQNFEKRYPYVYSVIVTLLSIIICSVFGNSPKLSNEVLECGITVGSIFVGFNAIYRNTLQISNNKTVESLKNSGYMQLYQGYLKAVLNCSLLFIFTSFILLFIHEDNRQNILIFNVWLFPAVLMLLCFYRANSLDSRLYFSR